MAIKHCLDPKDLNKAIKRNQWYNRMIDDVLPELANSKYLNLLHLPCTVPLNKESRLLTTLNTPWGRNRWLRLPFGLTVKDDAFQERLDRVLKSLASTTGIADDILCHGDAEIPHDAVAITLLLETERANYLTSSEEKFVFKTQLSVLWW